MQSYKDKIKELQERIHDEALKLANIEDRASKALTSVELSNKINQTLELQKENLLIDIQYYSNEVKKIKKVVKTEEKRSLNTQKELVNKEKELDIKIENLRKEKIDLLNENTKNSIFKEQNLSINKEIKQKGIDLIKLNQEYNKLEKLYNSKIKELASREKKADLKEKELEDLRRNLKSQDHRNMHYNTRLTNLHRDLLKNG